MMFQNKISHRNNFRFSTGSKSVFQCQAEGLLDTTLPKEKWTHGAHLTATLYLLRDKPELDLHKELPSVIKKYNETTGTENTDHSGYHATLTHFYIEEIMRFNSVLSKRISTVIACHLILFSYLANRAYPLQFYSREKLFSVEARRKWVAPDLGL